MTLPRQRRGRHPRTFPLSNQSTRVWTLPWRADWKSQVSLKERKYHDALVFTPVKGQIKRLGLIEYEVKESSPQRNDSKVEHYNTLGLVYLLIFENDRTVPPNYCMILQQN